VNVFADANKDFYWMLRKKYEVDQEFSLMMQLVGDLDNSMSEIDKILADEQLFKLIESDLSLRYPKTTKTGRKSTPIVSIFEAHTDIICRGKINVEVEFGHKVWLDEVDGGIISNYRILNGNPHDTQQLIPSLDQHIKNFGYPPTTVTADRGVYSQSNENYAQQLGIKEVILPKGGYRNSERIQSERKRRFKKARHWHNGVEGRISFLKRCFGARTLFVSRRIWIFSLGWVGNYCS